MKIENCILLCDLLNLIDLDNFFEKCKYIKKSYIKK